MTNSGRLSLWCALALSSASFLVLTPEAAAQRGGGGGGRGSGGLSTTPAPSPMARVREELKVTDYLQFLDDKSKQVGLEKAQKDSVKKLSKQMDEDQKPVFKEMDKMFAELERTMRQNGAAGGGGGGGARGGGGGGGGGDAGGGGGGRGGAGMPPEVRLLMTRMVEIQDSYASKAKELLTESQKPVADTLHTAWQADLRDRQRNRSRG